MAEVAIAWTPTTPVSWTAKLPVPENLPRLAFCGVTGCGGLSAGAPLCKAWDCLNPLQLYWRDNRGSRTSWGYENLCHRSAHLKSPCRPVMSQDFTKVGNSPEGSEGLVYFLTGLATSTELPIACWAANRDHKL